ncbi:hypothetical protein SD53_09620 [Rheinheimera mesophila]|nr:hypothetical protein SD53_09620 [Rheinheimera mesophila]
MTQCFGPLSSFYDFPVAAVLLSAVAIFYVVLSYRAAFAPMCKIVPDDLVFRFFESFSLIVLS